MPLTNARDIEGTYELQPLVGAVLGRCVEVTTKRDMGGHQRYLDGMRRAEMSGALLGLGQNKRD